MSHQFQPVFMTRALRIAAFVAVSLLVASSAWAALFTVTLENGTTFETRERPEVAEWDEDMVMLRTDRGNWIALRKDEIADVTSQAESTGFGYQLNRTTLFVGWTPGDIIIEGEEGEGGEGDGGGGGNRGRQAAEEDTPIDYSGGGDSGFDLDQFLDIPSGGGSVGSVDTSAGG